MHAGVAPPTASIHCVQPLLPIGLSCVSLRCVVRGPAASPCHGVHPSIQACMSLEEGLIPMHPCAPPWTDVSVHAAHERRPMCGVKAGISMRAWAHGLMWPALHAWLGDTSLEASTPSHLSFETPLSVRWHACMGACTDCSAALPRAVPVCLLACMDDLPLGHGPM